MFPMSTPEIVRAEQSHRLEGFQRWSRRHVSGDGGTGTTGTTGTAGSDATHPRHRRPTLRPAFGR